MKDDAESGVYFSRCGVDRNLTLRKVSVRLVREWIC